MERREGKLGRWEPYTSSFAASREQPNRESVIACHHLLLLRVTRGHTYLPSIYHPSRHVGLGMGQVKRIVSDHFRFPNSGTA